MQINPTSGMGTVLLCVGGSIELSAADHCIRLRWQNLPNTFSHRGESYLLGFRKTNEATGIASTEVVMTAHCWFDRTILLLSKRGGDE